MKAFTKFGPVQVLAVVCAIVLAASGCATTKNVMNKATFGLVGGGEKSDAQQTDTAKETKAERKAREKEEKQQREAEKRAAKDDERARKAAAKEEKQQEDKPGLMSRMTFGLVGGKSAPDETHQQEADAKAAEKDQKRQEKEAREQEKREAKAAKRQAEQEEEAQKREAKLAAKEERKAKEKEAATSEEANTPSPAPENNDAENAGGKRSLMSRMTFGLVGGKKSDASTDTAATTDASKEDKKAQKRAEKEQRAAEKQAKKDAEKAEKEQQEQAKADASTTEAAPKEKRTLMSRMTFGLVGGKKSDSTDRPDQTDNANAPDASAAPSDSTAAAEPAQPALPPEQLALAAPGDARYDVQPASALDGEARKLAKMSFKTSVDYSTKSASGKGQATASRETYSRNGYGITDLGDVRIAVEGMTFDGESRGGGVVISSDDRLAVGGKGGTGNNAFVYEYAKGVTAVQFGTVNFTIAKSVISIGGKSVPIGQGKKLVVVDGQGNVIGAYSAE